MNTKEPRICRLCLTAANKGYKKVDEFVKLLFDSLLLKVDLDITRDPIVCQDCMEVAKKFLKFKYTCLDTEKTIVSFFINRKYAKNNIKVIYKDGEHILTVSDEDVHICRFCLTRLKRSNFVSLDTLTNEMNMFEMLLVYMPEMDFNIIEDSIVCTTCRKNIEGYFKFLLNYLGVEGKIKAYCKDEGTDNRGQVKLSNLMVSTFTDVLENPAKFPQRCAREKELHNKNEDIGLEENSCKNLSEIEVDKYDDIDKCPKKFNEAIKRDVTLPKTIEHYTQPKQDAQLNSVRNAVPEIKMFKCSLCTYESKRSYDLSRHNMLVHKDISQIKVYKCSLCAFETKRENNLNAHMVVHKYVLDMYSCQKM